MKLSKDLIIIYVIAVLSAISIIVILGPMLLWDSDGYIKAWDNSLSIGKINDFRTPTYPILLGISKILIGDKSFYLVIIVQHLLFLFSIYFFYQILSFFVSSRLLVFITTLFYSIYPDFTLWNSCIQTESLAISGVVFLLYSLLCILRYFSNVAAISFILCLLFLIFLRPSFLYLLPLLLFFFLIYILFDKYHRSYFRIIVVGIISIIVLECFYCFNIYKEYGIISPSGVSLYNQYMIVRQDNMIKVDNISDFKIRNYIKERFDNENSIKKANPNWLLEEMNEIVEKFGYVGLSEITKQSYGSSFITFSKKAIGRFYKASMTQIVDPFGAFWGMPATQREKIYSSCIGIEKLLEVHLVINDMFPINRIGFLYALLVLYMLCILYVAYKRKKIAILSVLLFAIGISNMITVIIGAPMDWSRLSLPVMPLYLLMFAQLCTMFKVKSPLSIEFK